MLKKFRLYRCKARDLPTKQSSRGGITMKVHNKGTIRVELTNLETQKTVKQTFSNVKADQPEEAIVALSNIVASLTKGAAELAGTYQTVEYRIVKD